MTNTMITTIQVYDLADLGKQPANEYPQVKLATTEVDMLSLSEMLGGAIIIGAQRRKELMAERKKRMKERRKREEAFGRAHDWAAIEKALKEERKAAQDMPERITSGKADAIRKEIMECLMKGLNVPANVMAERYKVHRSVIYLYKRRCMDAMK